MLRTASLILRVTACSVVSSKAFLTYCWVMVEPPWETLPPLTFWNIARAMPTGLTPSCSKKLRSSMAMTASTTTSGTSSSATFVRFSSAWSRVIALSAVHEFSATSAAQM